MGSTIVSPFLPVTAPTLESACRLGSKTGGRRICLSRRSLGEGELVTAKSHHWGDEDGSSDSQGVPFNLKVDLDTGTYTRLNSVEGEIWKLLKNKKEGGEGVCVTWHASPSDWDR